MSFIGPSNLVKEGPPKRMSTYIVEEDEADDMDFDLFSPKRTAKVNMKTGLFSVRNEYIICNGDDIPGASFSFDFLDARPSGESKDNSDAGLNFEDSIGKAKTYDSRPPSLDEDDGINYMFEDIFILLIALLRYRRGRQSRCERWSDFWLTNIEQIEHSQTYWIELVHPQGCFQKRS